MFAWLISCIFLSYIQSKVYFTEEFDYTWRKRWVQSKYYEKDGLQGHWGWEIPLHYHNKALDFCASTTEANKYYIMSCDIGETFSNLGKDLIIAYTVKNQEKVQKSGAYLKLWPEGIDQEQISGDTPWYLMFGPDYNGKLNNMLRCAFRYRNRMFEQKAHHSSPTNEDTYLHTLVIHPDWTFEIHLNDLLERKENMEDQFDFVRPRLIPDPNAKKPADWCDEPEIYDPSVRKPLDWDQPMVIDDPLDEKPDDWNETLSGPFKPRKIPNPRYKGTWYPPIIPNPLYRGKWEPPLVPNPLFEQEKDTYAFQKIRYVGFDIWVEEPGILFDKIFIGDDWQEYRAYLSVTWEPFHRIEVAAEKEKTGVPDVRDAKPMGVPNPNSRQEREKRRKEEDRRMMEQKRKELEEEERRNRQLDVDEEVEEDEDDDDEFEEEAPTEVEIDVEEDFDKRSSRSSKSQDEL